MRRYSAPVEGGEPVPLSLSPLKKIFPVVAIRITCDSAAVNVIILLEAYVVAVRARVVLDLNVCVWRYANGLPVSCVNQITSRWYPMKGVP